MKIIEIKSNKDNLNTKKKNIKKTQTNSLKGLKQWKDNNPEKVKAYEESDLYKKQSKIA